MATAAFEPSVVAQGAALGFDPAVVYVPHPVADRSAEQMRALARDTLEAILNRIVGVFAEL